MKYQTWDRYLIMSDIHFPFHDQEAIDLTLKFAHDYNPKYIILDGDIMDCYSLSDFDKNPDRLKEATLADEVKLTTDFLKRLKKEFPKAIIIYIPGNHEERLARIIKRKAPELWGYVTIEKILGLKELGIKYIKQTGKSTHYNITKSLQVGHYNKVSQIPGKAGYDLMMKKFVSVIQAHVHRLGMIYHTAVNGSYVGIDCGCLCKVYDNGYVSQPNWQQGFVTVDVNRKTKHFTPSLIKIVREKGNKFIVHNGKEYTL